MRVVFQFTQNAVARRISKDAELCRISRCESAGRPPRTADHRNDGKASEFGNAV